MFYVKVSHKYKSAIILPNPRAPATDPDAGRMHPMTSGSPTLTSVITEIQIYPDIQIKSSILRNFTPATSSVSLMFYTHTHTHTYIYIYIYIYGKGIVSI